jgi:outer membrane protein assembly factor BamE (lipoprotein component of BamABCDE complex)
MRSRRSPAVHLTALATLLLTGCVIGRVQRDRPVREELVATIERGVTTKAQILEMLGPPQEIEARELVAVGTPLEPFLSRRGEEPPVEDLLGARYFRYTFARGNAFAVILVLFNYAEFDQKNDTLLVFFDADDVVEDFAFAKDTELLRRYGPILP